MAGLDSKIKGVNTSPTAAQKEAGNYKKAHISVNGFKITIENPKGSRRYYDGGKKYTVMKNHYGYFNGAMGYDGDQVDVFLGNDLDSDKIFVVDQKKSNGAFDESKVMFGFKSKKEAKDAYMSNYSAGWTGFMAITEVSIEKFKDWLYDGKKQRKPFSEYKNINESEMKKVNLTESDLHKIVKNCVKRMINEVHTDDVGDLMGGYDGATRPTNEPDMMDQMYNMAMGKIRRTGDFEDDLWKVSDMVANVMDEFEVKNVFNGMSLNDCASLVAREAIRRIDPIYYADEIEDDELFESVVRKVMNKQIRRIVKENKLTREDDFEYPKRSDDDDLDYQYEQWKSGQRPTKEDWDELYGGMPENDEPDLWQDEMGAAYDKEHGVYPLDADDEGEGFSEQYQKGVEFAKNLLAKSKDITGLVERLNALEDNQTINPFELGMLDTLDEG